MWVSDVFRCLGVSLIALIKPYLASLRGLNKKTLNLYAWPDAVAICRGHLNVIQVSRP